MSQFSIRPALRWLVPITAAVVVVGGGAVARTLTASAEPSLPDRSAAQLLVDLQTSRLEGLSGTVAQHSDLGLPDLGGALGGQRGSELSTLATGKNTLRVWYAGPEAQRLAVLSTLGETDLIRNGQDLWTWSSRDSSATHTKLPAGEPGAKTASELAGMTPQEAADKALAAITPTTEVSTGGTARVAGRSAYELIVAPKDAASLVRQVRLAIDAKTHVPLRVQIYPKGSDAAAFEVAFTQINFERPGAERFQFNPPPGTTVTEQDLTAQKDRAASTPKPTVDGTGWLSVLVGKMPTADSGPAADAPEGTDPAAARRSVETLIGNLPTVSGSWGSGHLFSGKLFTVLIVDDGRVLAGAVTPQRLYEVAGA